MEKTLFKAIEAAVKAGEKILEYRTDKIDIDYKEDDSPLTKADLASNKIITELLWEFGIPILSEESSVENYDKRKNWKELWIVDPLDGTKEFIANREEFTVNIALLQNGE
ncbi:MAG: 3'(2'),5'-bisphosphate nucleotidase CysQ, partial [Bacteroidales bacterium]|nr:3'(2'),5'-bisphosphate nucleotidase CysQ [Bacteroidales bacterium]